jgi:hypothetical protein
MTKHTFEHSCFNGLTSKNSTDLNISTVMDTCIQLKDKTIMTGT